MSAPANDAPGPEHAGGLRGLVADILRLDRGALAILVAAPLLLTLLDYYGMPWQYPQRAGFAAQQSDRRPLLADQEMRSSAPPFAELLKGLEMPGPEPVRHYVWWGAACLVLLVLLPMLVAGVCARRSPRDLGVRLKGTGRDAWTYLALFALFFPVVWYVSLSEDFQRTYPFYKPTGGRLGADFLVFQIVYCAQFFAVEFFFRGFMVLGLKRALGWASVLVMIAPYCMIHYYKPMPEALGAIGAGLVLGALSWRTGTILYGWALHYGVALSMDLLALHHRGLL